MSVSGESTDALAQWEDDGGATTKGASGPSGARSGTFEAHSQHHGRRVRSQVGAPTASGQQGEELPIELADWFTKPLAQFFKVEVAAAVMLLIATIAAVALANSGWASPFLAFWETPLGVRLGEFEFSRSLNHWINDGLMTLFFFVIALELKREIVLGELQDIRTAALSFAGALGGVLFPACIFLLIMRGNPEISGWGTVIATDTAFAIGCLALFGSRIPPSLRIFILSLAIFDDVWAILVVAIGYGESMHWGALAAAVFGVITLAGLAYIGIRSMSVYFVVGIAIWLCCDSSGIHPTLAGVAMGLMTPTGRWISNLKLRAILAGVLSRQRGNDSNDGANERRGLRQVNTATRESLSPVERLEFMLHPWVGFAILPLFALANAGVAFSGTSPTEPLVIAIMIGFVIGKPVGVLSMSWLAVRLGIASRPAGLTWPLMAGGGFLTGIGFTMALFIAGLAFTPEKFDDAKLGILLSSVISAIAGILTLFWASRISDRHIFVESHDDASVVRLNNPD